MSNIIQDEHFRQIILDQEDYRYIITLMNNGWTQVSRVAPNTFHFHDEFGGVNGAIVCFSSLRDSPLEKTRQCIKAGCNFDLKLANKLVFLARTIL